MDKQKANPLLKDEAVCKTLIAHKLLSPGKAKEVLRQKEGLVDKLERIRKKKYEHTPVAEIISNPLTLIDVIVSLKISREDRPDLPLDEEIIYQTLAQEWKIPYYKLDPLKLDLNVVTTTIPRIFAMKHLVLPVDVKDGVLTVATPDPFNLEVIDDIAMASKLRVQVVVSPQSEVIKLINEFFGFKHSIVAAQDQFVGPGVDLGNLEQYVRSIICSYMRLTSAPAIFISSLRGNIPLCACALMGCCIPSTSCPRRCIRPLSAGSRI
jgi:general secretion pathway protein E